VEDSRGNNIQGVFVFWPCRFVGGSTTPDKAFIAHL
jgi:hypothetical protein